MFVHAWSSAQVALRNVNITCVGAVTNGSGSVSNNVSIGGSGGSSGGSAQNALACLSTKVGDAAALLAALNELQATAAAMVVNGVTPTLRIMLTQSITVRWQTDFDYEDGSVFLPSLWLFVWCRFSLH